MFHTYGFTIFVSCFCKASKKKVYMLFNLEPDQSVTGGSWYSDQDFESEFVDVLNQQCFKFLQQKVGALSNHLPLGFFICLFIFILLNYNTEDPINAQ